MQPSALPRALLVAAAALAACAPSPNAQLEANKALVRQFMAVLNAGDWDALDTLVAENVRRHSQSTPEMPELGSLDEFKRLQQSFLASFPDQRVTVGMLVAEGDLVATYATYSGTNSGPMGDLPATGKSASVKFLGILRIENGRIAEMWVEWDNMAILTQLGLYPPPVPVGVGSGD